MASDTAFTIEAPYSRVDYSAYESLGKSTDLLASQRVDSFDRPDLTPRLLSGITNNLRVLGVDIDENNKILKSLEIFAITNYSLYALYNAYRAYVMAQEAKELAAATAETATLAVAQQWHLIAQGFIAAGMAYGAFQAGKKFGSGQWNLPSVNMSNPVSRRAGLRKVQATQFTKTFYSREALDQYEKDNPYLVRVGSPRIVGLNLGKGIIIHATYKVGA